MVDKNGAYTAKKHLTLKRNDFILFIFHDNASVAYCYFFTSMKAFPPLAWEKSSRQISLLSDSA